VEIHSKPPASQGEETSLLAMVENWSPQLSEVEEKASSLLENAKKVDCICLMADKLVGLEDSYCCVPYWGWFGVLGGGAEHDDRTEENRVVIFSLVCTLMEQTEKVVRH
jgi:hypothetical protein